MAILQTFQMCKEPARTAATQVSIIRTAEITLTLFSGAQTREIYHYTKILDGMVPSLHSKIIRYWKVKHARLQKNTTGEVRRHKYKRKWCIHPKSELAQSSTCKYCKHYGPANWKIWSSLDKYLQNVPDQTGCSGPAPSHVDDKANMSPSVISTILIITSSEP